MKKVQNNSNQVNLATKWNAFKNRLISVFSIEDKPLGRGSVFDVPSLPESMFKSTEQKKSGSNTGSE